MSDKRPIGRPSKYKKEYCEMLIEHMSSGLSFESFAGVIGVCDDTLREWWKAHPDFSAASKVARAKNRLWWENAGIQGLYMGGKDSPFNASVWIFNMKNRHGWTDKKEFEVNQSTVQINIEKNDLDL